MYPRNAASPERIAIGPVILIADGTPQSSGVTVTVRGQGGAEAGSAGTIAYGATGVAVYYTPTQAETNFTSFTLIASKASCIPVCVTVITSASATPGYAGVDWGFVANPTTTNGLTGTTIATSQVVASVTGAVGSVTGLTAANLDATVSSRLATAGYTAPPSVATILTTAITEAYRANGAAPTLAQFISEVLAHLGESSISGVTKTINKLDHSTPAETFTLDSATVPAAITRAS